MKKRVIWKNPLKQQYRATKDLEKWINNKNKEFLKEYSSSFEKLKDEKNFAWS
ncbi:hypothetical protein [Borreliella burgdorferi]|uniref:hypothetical protein n=1 Tax=Borreliella burgdorferi TaxID=139 RepID=UPI001304B3F3|nr:hypothetical protein [Borreliella burgdorferi]MCD2386250.1 hypothetical protein [Borreliella burgdorferi]MCD2387498.1 hypothetical protein [Borreliella burgdorferi]MCD2390432.1 hypothetical protein [Borreliella burgdorferi]